MDPPKGFCISMLCMFRNTNMVSMISYPLMLLQTIKNN